MSTAMIYKTVSTSSDDTARLGELLGQILKAPAVVELRSDLGGGKTTFAKGLAKGFGINEALTSPTFSICKTYKSKTGSQLHHYDFYRLDEPGIIADQIEQSLKDLNTLTIVEWADIVKSALPENHLAVVIKPIDNDSNQREIEFHYPESKFALIKQLEMAWQGIKP